MNSRQNQWTTPPPRPAAPPPGGLGILPRSPSEQLEPSRATEPPRQRRRRNRERKPRFAGFVNFVGGGMTFLLMAMLAVGAGYQILKYQFSRPGPLSISTVVVVPKGEGVDAIASRLVREGVLEDKWVFMLGVQRFNAGRKLRAGEYEFPQQASARQVLDILVDGKAILHKVSVPEGWTSFQVVEALNREPLLTGELADIPPEGSLLPDTYRFDRGTPRTEMVARMQAAQRRFIETAWANRQPGLPVTTLEEAIVLASVVEKETGRADERRHVASVFTNRLRRGMRLQSDPTIIYGITLGRGSLGRGLRRSEIDQKTAYNTYQIDGLPPGPIANPGRAALEAVLNPLETDDLFFVADGTGGHVFAKTYEEHRANVGRWRQIERQIRARQAAAVEASGGTSAGSGATVAGAGSSTSAAGSAARPSVVAPPRNPRR